MLDIPVLHKKNFKDNKRIKEKKVIDVRIRIIFIFVCAPYRDSKLFLLLVYYMRSVLVHE